MILFPKTLQFSLQAVDTLQCTVASAPARLELAVNHPLPTGWFLLKGRVYHRDMTSSAKLVAVAKDAYGQTVTLPVPVSRKGTIFELFHLPKGIVRLVIDPARSGEFDVRDISITPVGQIERIARMYRRVIPMIFKQSRIRRQKAGLYFYTPVMNLQKAYHIAGRFRDYSPEQSYEKWLQEHDTLADKDRRLIRRHIKRWKRQPHFKIFIVVKSARLQDLKNSLKSLRKQLYRKFSVTVLLPSESKVNINLLHLPPWVDIYRSKSQEDLVEFANAELRDVQDSTWIVCMSDGAILTEYALYWLASEAVRNKKAAFIYSDHDLWGEGGVRSDPVFKPEWSPELLRSTNYIRSSAAVRTDVLIKSGGISSSDLQDDDNHNLYLQVSEHIDAEAIRHVPAVLWHLPETSIKNSDLNVKREPNPVARHLRRIKVAASVEQMTTGHYRLRYELPEKPPMVSIVVPTRDALSHLRACVESVLDKSSYRNFELLIVDNQSCKPSTLEYLRQMARRPNVRVLRYDRPFNYSDINNFAAKHARGEVLCLLNNDTEVITPDWMEEMLGQLLQPGVGIVGAKLYYSDGRVQHAGDTVGPGGCAHHLHAMIGRDDPGYCNRAILAQDLSAVTAACLMTRRARFRQLGGLDRRNLPIAFNDVDYCLRVRETGLRVVWTPHAELYHHESVSRGKENSPEKERQTRREINYMRRRWKHLMSHDPFYNLNLSYDRPDFSLNIAPLVKKPWRN